MANEAIIGVKPLEFMWPVTNPFLFCVHHLDLYPAGNEEMGPVASLKGRNIGQDFDPKESWRMYHGETIPGFPVHPHRGFETVTIVVDGFIDHSDSYNQAGRYGKGDVQWLTAGAGIQHSEMFPLLNKNKDNKLELFQIWLNLPKGKKFATPYFKMLWAEDIPLYKIKDENGKSVEVNVIAGKLNSITPISPAPDSWAANPENEVAIWTIRMDAGAQWTLPSASDQVNRVLYLHQGLSIRISGTDIFTNQSVELKVDRELKVVNGESESFLLLLQGKPINEPVVQYGPFVMNTESEIRQAMNDFHQTEFGGWPWPRRDQVYPRSKGRFALYSDGSEETP
jgi:hypothetical protein